MIVLAKLFEGEEDVFSSFIRVHNQKKKLWDRLLQGGLENSEMKKLGVVLKKEVQLLEALVRLNARNPLTTKWKIVRRILDNLRKFPNDKKQGVIYDTSNLRFLRNYRSDSAVKAAKMLRSRIIRSLPKYMDEFSRAGFSEKDIFRERFFHIDRIFSYLAKIKKNTQAQKKLVERMSLYKRKVNPSALWKSKFKEQAFFHLIKHYLTSAIRRTVIRVKMLCARLRLERLRSKPRKSLFFVFGGMEDRYLPLIGNMIKKLGEIFVLKVHKVDNFLYYVRLNDHDLYFAICIGASSRYYPSYYYLPSANDLIKFIRRYIGKANVERLLLFGVCGSFKDKRGAVYLPRSYSALFYKFENRVKLENLGMIQKRRIHVKNFFSELVKAREVDIFTCSTIFNRAIVGVEEVMYKELKGQVSDKKDLRGAIEDYKLSEFLKCAKHIAKRGLADGVEMESYMFARHFPNKFGCYLEVSDNILKKDDVSFDMGKFSDHVNASFERLIKRTIALMWL